MSIPFFPPAQAGLPVYLRRASIAKAPDCALELAGPACSVTRTREFAAAGPAGRQVQLVAEAGRFLHSLIGANAPPSRDSSTSNDVAAPVAVQVIGIAAPICT